MLETSANTLFTVFRISTSTLRWYIVSFGSNFFLQSEDSSCKGTNTHNILATFWSVILSLNESAPVNPHPLPP